MRFRAAGDGRMGTDGEISLPMRAASEGALWLFLLVSLLLGFGLNSEWPLPVTAACGIMLLLLFGFL